MPTTTVPHPLPPLSVNPQIHPDCCLSLSTTLISRTASLILDTTGTESGPALVLSIGCGSGLFEAYLQDELNARCDQLQNPDRNKAKLEFAEGHPTLGDIRIQAESGQSFGSVFTVEGVEVHASASEGVVKYLPEQSVHYVPGTWSVISPRAFNADVLMFVYPRSVDLVRKYLSEHLLGHSTGVAETEDCQKLKLVLWFGPRADWVGEYENVFDNFRFEASDRQVGWHLEELNDLGVSAYEMAVCFKKVKPVTGV